MKQWILDNPEAALALALVVYNVAIDLVRKVSPRAADAMASFPYARGIVAALLPKKADK